MANMISISAICIFLIFVRTSHETTVPTITQETVTDSYQNTANKDSQITWAAVPDTAQYSAGDVTYSPGSMKGIYDFSRNFVNNVFPNGVPWDSISKAINGSLMTDVSSNYMSYASQFAGWATCIVVGFLFMLIFPLIGCIFCCCRCCGNCGGEMKQTDENAEAHCRRRTYAVVLLILVLFQFAGMVCVFVSNDRFTSAVENLDTAVTSNLDDIDIFLNQTVDQVKYVAQNNFNFTLDVIFRDLDSIGYYLGIPIQTALKQDSKFDTAISSALTLAETSTTLMAAYTKLNTSVNTVKADISTLSTDMSGLKTNITNTKADGSCSGCGTLDTTNIAVGVDSSNFPDTDSQMEKISSVNDRNLTSVVLDAQADMDNIPFRVENETKTTIDTVKSDIRTFSDKLDPAVEEIEKLQSDVNLGDLKSDASSYMTIAKKYNNYRWYGGIVLSCFILIIVVLELLGLLFAVIGHDSKAAPTERGCMANSGGNMLMASVGFIFIFSWLLMLLTTLSFTIGSPMERFVCQPLTDPTFADLDKIVDEYVYEVMVGGGKTGTVLGNILHNDTIDIPVSTFLKGCQVGRTAYSVLKMNETINITAYTNFRSSLNFDEKIKDISKDVDLDTFSILTSDLQSQLEDLKSAAGIDFDGFRTELTKSLTLVNLTKLAEDLRTLSAASTSPAKEDMAFHANQAEAIRDSSYAQLETDVATLLKDLDDVEAAVNGSNHANKLNLTEQVDNLLNDLNVTEQFIQQNGSSVISAKVDTFANRLFDTVDSYVDDTLLALDNEVGKCTPVWNFYNSLVVSSFCGYSIETLNGFWFSLGWVIFFFIPSVIFSVKLAKHYRKMKHVQNYDDPIYEDKSNGPEVHSDGGFSYENNSKHVVLPLSSTSSSNRVSPAGMSNCHVRTESPKPDLSDDKQPFRSSKKAKASVIDTLPVPLRNKVGHSDNVPAIGYQQPRGLDSDW